MQSIFNTSMSWPRKYAERSTRRERNAVRAELAKAIAAQAEIERAAAAHDQSAGGDHMPKVLNARQAGTKPAADRVYVGRPSKWGNRL